MAKINETKKIDLSQGIVVNGQLFGLTTKERIESGNLGGWLVESGEKASAGSVKVKYTLKSRPWVVSIEAKRIYDNKQ